MRSDRIYKMTFSSVYPHYVNKILRKERSVEDLDELLMWLTGYSEAELEALKTSEKTFLELFDEAPLLNPKVSEITGMICGYRIEEIEDPLMKKMRYMDKIVDELGNGRPMYKIKREAKP
ncbi:MAG: DUF2200 domain-containing protein [Erysipelothrix sp.]|nr:DUF2200 domain-containing protein [Erysipelothrix sp.]